MVNKIGVFGLGVMGSSLALNIARNGFPVVVYNYTYDLTQKFLNRAEKNYKILGARTVYEFISSLDRPRQILLMVTAGKAVDSVISILKPHLSAGDILIDGGNSFYQDSERRFMELEIEGVQFIGMGVSGGEQGALWGPSLMPGGDEGTYFFIEPWLKKIAAKVEKNQPCVTYIGKRSAGHFVKMVHNGIEYGDMQLIAEAYDLLRFGLGLNPAEIAGIFQKWNDSELSSYLIEITSKIVNFPDDLNDSGILLDKILDRAGMKGTGTWTGQAALDIGEPIPTIIAALHARALSSLTEERIPAQKSYGSRVFKLKGKKENLVEKIKNGMYASKICSYAQGFALLKRASEEYQYDLNLAGIAGIWRGGCIIRAAFLEKILAAFKKNGNLTNLLLDELFVQELKPRVSDWREIIASGIKAGIPLPAMSASLAYFEALRRKNLPANLIQAQRDFFGSHTYKRIDREGTFHTEWETETR
jgi:6-phosphogluconate dehydrogenase